MKAFVSISLFLAGIMLVFSSCREIVEINLNDDKNSRLVVEGHITTEPAPHTIKLTRTADYFSNEPTPRETGATVSISDGTDTYLLEESTTEPGIYNTPSGFRGKVGRNYLLNIESTDGRDYNSTAYLDTVFDLDSILYYYFPNPYFGQEGPFGSERGFYIFTLYAQEPGGMANNYLFNIYYSGSDGIVHWDNDTLNEAIYQSDEYIDGEYLMGMDFYYMGASKVDEDSIHILVEMMAIPEELIDYNTATLQETAWQGGFFASIPANVPSNISDGALGFFYAGDITKMEFTLYKMH